jgi:two-component system, sensor histidine kinase and response regulator
VQQHSDGGTPYALVLLDWQMPGMDGLEVAQALQALQLPSPPRLLMVTGYGREEVIRGAAQLQIDQVLMKPVNASTLFDGIVQALGPADTQTVSTTATATATPPTEALPLLQARARGQRVLLVEDNLLNQEVARELLQEAGLQVEVADNGQLALDLLARQAFDLVLMDMQMPVMDGLSATRLLRQQPQWQGLPVLAMTANSGVHDIERCLAAGMNAHLAKPIEPDALWQALLQWLPAPGATPQNAPRTEPPRPAPPVQLPGVDTAAGLRRAMGKPGFYRSLLQRFADSEKQTVARLQAALSAQDWAQAERLAHTTKGVAGHIGAQALQQAAEALEKAIAQHAHASELQHLLQALDRLLTPLLQAILALPANGTAQPAPATALSYDQAYHALLHSLQQADAGSADLLQSHAAGLQAGLGEHCASLRQQVMDFDFEAAINTLLAHPPAP